MKKMQIWLCPLWLFPELCIGFAVLPPSPSPRGSLVCERRNSAVSWDCSLPWNPRDLCMLTFSFPPPLFSEGKGKRVFLEVWLRCLCSSEEQQMCPVVQITLWKGEDLCTPSLYDECDLSLMPKPHRFTYIKLEAVAAMRIQSPIANGLRV